MHPPPRTHCPRRPRPGIILPAGSGGSNVLSPEIPESAVGGLGFIVIRSARVRETANKRGE